MFVGLLIDLRGDFQFQWLNRLISTTVSQHKRPYMSDGVFDLEVGKFWVFRREVDYLKSAEIRLNLSGLFNM